jgi:hypothetical protein
MPTLRIAAKLCDRTVNAASVGLDFDQCNELASPQAAARGKLRAVCYSASMTRHKGRQSAKAVERDFPHFVDMVVA